MIKKISIGLFFTILLFFISISYLSIYGLETNKFNNLITKKFQEKVEKGDLELDSVRLILNIKEFGLDIRANNPIIKINKQEIKLNFLKTKISFDAFLNKRFSFLNVKGSLKENDIRNIFFIIKYYYNKPQIYILEKLIKKGRFIANFDINFNEKGVIKKNFNIEGKVLDLSLKDVKGYKFDQINLNFKINNDEYKVHNLQFKLNEIQVHSKSLNIQPFKNYSLIRGLLSTKKTLLDRKFLNKFFDTKKYNLNLDNLQIKTESRFSLEVFKIFEIKNLNIDSKMNISNLIFNNFNKSLPKYLPTLKKDFELVNQKINLQIKNKELNLKGSGDLVIDDKKDKIDYKLEYKNKVLHFKIIAELLNNIINIPELNYTKNSNVESSLKLVGKFSDISNIKFEEIKFESESNYINALNLDIKNNKLQNINQLKINLINNSKKINEIEMDYKNKNYKIIGKSLDASKIIDNIINSENEKSIFYDLSSKINISIEKFYIDNENYLNNLNSKIEYKKNKINNLNLEGEFNKNQKLIFRIFHKGLIKNTFLYSDFAKPLVKRYKFIKGFEEGTLELVSTKINDKSTSNLKITDFKLKEMPVLTKLLTLASLQGIADILTGEGIRFNDFEMSFQNENKKTIIEDLYAIGPAISIMMNGYVQKNELVSLKGTLVPATTINKFISTIPVLGEILVGNKTGEGVFGVSFKIKGSPKKLKTSVNPIKTLTPRFISRTLEKIKQ